MTDEEQNTLVTGSLVAGRLLEAREIRRPLLEMTIYTVEDLAAIVAMLPDLIALIRGEAPALAEAVAKLRESNDRVAQRLSQAEDAAKG